MSKRKINFPANLSFRDYQLDFISTAKRLMKSEPENWHLFYSPTGTGKSICEGLLLNELDNGILVTPRIEIIRDMLEKGGQYCETINEIVTRGQEFGIHTPIRLRNNLASGNIGYRPEYYIVDEAQHDLAETYQDLIMYLNYCAKCGLTATPFRGSPKQTQKFRQQWNNKIHTIISLKRSVDENYISIPVPSIWPLYDDDEIKVENNEFKSKTVNSLILDRIKDLVIRCRQFWDRRAQLWDRPTIFAVSTTEIVNKLVLELNLSGLPAVAITQASTRKQRELAFERVKNCCCAIVQIDVISEGVDLPIRRLIDLKPTMSPVRWLQQVGRITRPTALQPEYICCCRNLERHGYLMEGMFPNNVIIESQQIFGEPSKRSGMRAVGLEGLGKFTHTPIHCLNGSTAFMYNLISVSGYTRTEYVFIVHPNSTEPLYAKRESNRDTSVESEHPMYKWGKWQLIDSVPDLIGFSSAKPSNLTDKQMEWWKKDCETFGLNPHKKVTNRTFQVLPLLANLSQQFGKRIKF